MITNKILFLATKEQPNPIEVDYWIDLVANPYGGIIKYFNGEEWVTLNVGTKAELFDYYTKAQVNELLNSKVDDDADNRLIRTEDLAKTVSSVSTDSANTDTVTLIIQSYTGDQTTVQLPTASTGQAGIITATDFADFVKQHQLSELRTEVITGLANVRSDMQGKLKAGKHITIADDNTISATLDDEQISWSLLKDAPDVDSLTKTINSKVVKGTETSNTPTDLLVDYNDDNAISVYTADQVETAIAYEKSRAIKAEKLLQDNIDNEVARATIKENQLQEDLNTEVDARTASISEETARATKIENNLQLHISRNLNDLTKKINTVDEKLIVDTTADANIEVYTKAQIDAMFTQLKQKNNLI